jgi:hypothetical protein
MIRLDLSWLPGTSALIAGALVLGGCADDKRRAAAAHEAAEACNIRPAEASVRHDQYNPSNKTIMFAIFFDDQNKKKCIKRFRSKDGYRFNTETVGEGGGVAE